MNRETIVTSFGTILEMLRDRGHDTGGIEKAHLDEIIKRDSIKPVIEVVVNKTKVVYFTPTKFKWADVRKHFEDEEPFAHYILVVCEAITQNNLKSMNAVGVPIEVHLLGRLQFNITKHVLVPKHEVIRDKSEVQRVLEMYSLKSKFQLPIIMRSDPIARYYGMKNGDLVRITRSSETAGEYVTYRCCL